MLEELFEPGIVDERTRELVQRRRAGKLHQRGWIMRRALTLADLSGLILAFLLAEIFFGTNAPNSSNVVAAHFELLVFALSLPGWILLAKLYHLYERDEERAEHSNVDDVTGVFNMLTLGAWTFFALCWLTGIAEPSVPKLILFWGAAIVLVSLGRVGARALCRRSQAYVQNTLIVGAGEVGQTVARKLLQHPEYGVNLAGFVDDEPRERSEGLADLIVLGGIHDLPEIVRALEIERVIVAFSRDSHDETLDFIRELNTLGVRIDVVPRLFEVFGFNTRLHSAEGLPLLGLPRASLSRSSLFLKRTMDVVLSGLALGCLAPLFAVVALAIKLDTPGPVFFRQTRMGCKSRCFEILKFRTMVFDADEHKGEVAALSKHAQRDARMFKIPDDPRVTRVGRLLRSYSLDELPQLWNVLCGEMSLVGPRPLILDEDQYVDGWCRHRLDLKPGITGLWQVLGRDGIPFGEMVSLDYLYVTNWSLGGDLKLVLRTLPVLVRGHAV